jgi:large subunit ribosomal protein L23
MNDQQLYRILINPLTTEKSVRVAEKNRQFVFKVALSATKTHIQEAVQKLFSVQVDSVHTVRVKGKVKQFKQRTGQRSDWKKAYVCLKEGHDINFANFQ